MLINKRSLSFHFNNILIQFYFLRVKYSSNLRLTHNQIKNIRTEYLLLQDSYSKTIQNWKIYLQTIDNTLQKTMDKYRIEIEQTHTKYKYIYLFI